ncbi:hypothetical protein V6N13_033616 [Hibiscus sabdariffa]|uniref:Uncharacterized protein n=1 Tax=Hibiscus sabdariffa TaxID=183260 RepID=A0ABR2FA13_9ROSI
MDNESTVNDRNYPYFSLHRLQPSMLDPGESASVVGAERAQSNITISRNELQELVSNAVQSCINQNGATSTPKPLRGYFLGRRPRRKIFPARKYVPTRRPAQVRPSLFNSRTLTDRLSLQTMHENQFGNEFSVANNGSITAYITYPSLGTLEPNRHYSYIKLNRLQFNGTAQIQLTQTDVIMDPSSPIPIPRLNGVLSVVIVLDRKPHMDSGSKHFDRFDEVFGANAFSHGNL